MSRFVLGSVAVYLFLMCSAKKILRKWQIKSNVVHYSIVLLPLPRLRKNMLDKKKHAVCLAVRCSAVFSLKQCVLLPDADSVASTSSLEKIYVWQKKLCSLLAHPMQCGFHSEAVRSAVWCCSARKCKEIVKKAKKSNAVHFLIVLWFIYTRCEVHFTFSS